MLFTPRTKDGERLKLDIEKTDIPRGCRWSKIVTEIGTGQRWQARGAACSIPGCMCDAIAERI